MDNFKKQINLLLWFRIDNYVFIKTNNLNTNKLKMSLTREQQLLIDEIINKGYDSDEFQDYVC